MYTVCQWPILKITGIRLKFVKSIKQPLNNFEPLKSWECKQFWLGHDHSCL